MSDDDIPDEVEEDAEDDEDLCEIVAGATACERCEALDGHLMPYLQVPVHPHCDCEVRMVYPHQRRDKCDHTWELRHEMNTHYGPDGYGLISSWTIIVTCDDGFTYEADAAVDHGPNAPFDFETVFEEAWNELYDDAEEILAQNCRACPPERIV